jgi:amino-acid N-acetyltransferase
LLDLAEIRSVVVREELRSQGVGARLVRACIDEGCALGLPRVYALTRVPSFFVKLGFREIDKHELPHKVFKDCVRCPLFPDCDEVAMVLDLPPGGCEVSD